ncbi:hypothetical protein LguiA_006895 [Lonicera macranthoides]
MDQQKAVKSKNKLLKLLPKAASAVNFQNPLHSPKRDNKRCENVTKLKSHLGKNFSGPIISIIPAEARRKSKNSSFEAQQEPTSPKISCMGQIKSKKKITNNPKNPTPPEKAKKKKPPPPQIKKAMSFSGEKVKKTSAFPSIFGGAKPAGRKSDASGDHLKPPLPDRAPSLSQMRRFASGRDTFSNFDWTAQIAPVDSKYDYDYYCDDSDEERGDSYDDDVIIPFSAPMNIGGGRSGIGLEPRKEINLWKRRTMAQPKPLKLNTIQ